MSTFTDPVRSTVSLEVLVPSDTRPDFSTTGVVTVHIGSDYISLGESLASITASTTHTLAGATAITTNISKVTTANASDAIFLPVPSLTGQKFVINNVSANAGTLFAAGGVTINGTAGATGVSYAASANTNVIATSLTTYVTY